jgi:hypothetical protein
MGRGDTPKLPPRQVEQVGRFSGIMHLTKENSFAAKTQDYLLPKPKGSRIDGGSCQKRRTGEILFYVQRVEAFDGISD